MSTYPENMTDCGGGAASPFAPEAPDTDCPEGVCHSCWEHRADWGEPDIAVACDLCLTCLDSIVQDGKRLPVIEREAKQLRKQLDWQQQRADALDAALRTSNGLLDSLRALLAERVAA